MEHVAQPKNAHSHGEPQVANIGASPECAVQRGSPWVSAFLTCAACFMGTGSSPLNKPSFRDDLTAHTHGARRDLAEGKPCARYLLLVAIYWKQAGQCETLESALAMRNWTSFLLAWYLIDKTGKEGNRQPGRTMCVGTNSLSARSSA